MSTTSNYRETRDPEIFNINSTIKMEFRSLFCRFYAISDAKGLR
jgi:hypothetical protein